MKLRITTIVSLVGVLGAGSAAALVNTQVLQNTGTKSGAEVTVGTPAGPDSTSGTTVTGSEVTKINSAVLTSSQAMYQIGDAGVVTLDSAGNVLTIVSATPSAGWTVAGAENSSATSIQVKLQSATTLIEFKANLEGGVITTTVEAKTIGTSSNPGSTPANGNTPNTGNTPSTGTVDDSYPSVTVAYHDDDESQGGNDD